MARLEMEHKQENPLDQEYTHKKFNCGYSHKKLGLCLRQRELDNKENTLEQQQQPEAQKVKTNKPHKDLFRPYALGENTPRKRKTSKSTEKEISAEENSPLNLKIPQTLPQDNQLYQQQSYPEALVAPPPMASVQYCYIPALSPNSYALRLQRQRAALYMRYWAQFGQLPALNLQTPTAYPMGYPNVTAPIFYGC